MGRRYGVRCMTSLWLGCGVARSSGHEPPGKAIRGQLTKASAPPGKSCVVPQHSERMRLPFRSNRCPDGTPNQRVGARGESDAGS